MNLPTVNPDVWTTYDGREIPFDEVTHSHWSNIYHHHMMILKFPAPPQTQIICLMNALVALEQICVRFNGQILPYNPPPHGVKL